MREECAKACKGAVRPKEWSKEQKARRWRDKLPKQTEEARCRNE